MRFNPLVRRVRPQHKIVVRDIPIESLVISPFNVIIRARSIRALTESIRAQGVSNPVLIRPTRHRYEVVAGARIFMAAKTAGLKAIPAVIQEMDPAQAVALSLAEESVLNGNLDIEERIAAYDKIRAFCSSCTTLTGLATFLGTSRASIAQDTAAHRASLALQKHGIRVVSGMHPKSVGRQEGRAISVRLAILLEQTMSRVRETIAPEEQDATYAMLARRIAPLSQREAHALLQRVGTDVSGSLDESPICTPRMERIDWVLSSSTIRHLETLVKESRARNAEEYISQLVKEEWRRRGGGDHAHLDGDG